MNKIPSCGVAVISNPAVCDICVFKLTVCRETKLFVVLRFLVSCLSELHLALRRPSKNKTIVSCPDFYKKESNSGFTDSGLADLGFTIWKLTSQSKTSPIVASQMSLHVYA